MLKSSRAEKLRFDGTNQSMPPYTLASQPRARTARRCAGTSLRPHQVANAAGAIDELHAVS